MVLCPKCGAKFHKVGHMQVFDEKRIREILEKKGFEIIKIKCLPLGFMARRRFLKHFWIFLEQFRFINSNNLFVVAMKK